jgi:predicted CXXCH cytochrome family protein
MFPHSAISLGGCASCHQAHGSDFRELLVDRFPEEDYLPAVTENFELCFLCHDTGIMDQEETESATGFRDGKKNLHWLHINGTKGRNCRMCHNMHGSLQPYLVEDRVRFGEWVMEMNFVPEEQGGSCLPGCHGKLAYSR